jgi:hypothetical protein
MYNITPKIITIHWEILSELASDLKRAIVGEAVVVFVGIEVFGGGLGLAAGPPSTITSNFCFCVW